MITILKLVPVVHVVVEPAVLHGVVYSFRMRNVILVLPVFTLPLSVTHTHTSVYHTLSLNVLSPPHGYHLHT